MRIEKCGQVVRIREVASVQRMPRADDPVDPPDQLRLVRLHRNPKRYFPACVRCLREVVRQLDGSWVEQGWTDPVSRKRYPGGRVVHDPGNPGCLASGAIQHAEIAG